VLEEGEGGGVAVAVEVSSAAVGLTCSAVAVAPGAVPVGVTLAPATAVGVASSVALIQGVGLGSGRVSVGPAGSVGWVSVSVGALVATCVALGGSVGGVGGVVLALGSDVGVLLAGSSMSLPHGSLPAAEFTSARSAGPVLDVAAIAETTGFDMAGCPAPIGTPRRASAMYKQPPLPWADVSRRRAPAADGESLTAGLTASANAADANSHGSAIRALLVRILLAGLGNECQRTGAHGEGRHHW